MDGNALRLIGKPIEGSKEEGSDRTFLLAVYPITGPSSTILGLIIDYENISKKVDFL